jgi:hypothetical protein
MVTGALLVNLPGAFFEFLGTVVLLGGVMIAWLNES